MVFAFTAVQGDQCWGENPGQTTPVMCWAHLPEDQRLFLQLRATVVLARECHHLDPLEGSRERSTVSSSGLPSSREMRSYWRESSAGLQV